MPNNPTETYEQEQRNIKQGSQNQQEIENPREEEQFGEMEEDEELSTADGDDTDLLGGEEETGHIDDQESIDKSADDANESGVGGGDLDEGNAQRDAGQLTNDGRRQADDVDIERDVPKGDEMEEE